MNVYNRATGWGTFVALLVLAGTLVLDIWLLDKLPVLRHGFGYAVLQLGMVGLLITVLRVIFRGGNRDTSR